MKDFKIYLSGGMSGLSWEEQSKWREKVKKYISRHYALKFKADFFNPIQYYNFQEKRHDSELEVMNFDIRNVKNSDLILVNFNSPNSIGTAQELAVAWDNRIPIIGIKDAKTEIHAWLKEDCDKIFTDLYAACDYIMDFYLR